MNGSTEARLRRLVNPEVRRSDPVYASMTELFRQWLNGMEDAMHDEHIDQATAERVLNRVVYGCPHAADGIMRTMERDRQIQALRTSPPIPFFGPAR
jgi:truncated hemoglobin YjbI